MWEILWKNVKEFPASIYNDFKNFLGSFWDPNEGLLENIFYGDWTWILLFIIFLTATKGRNIFTIIGALLSIWLLGNIIILAFGIKFFFSLAIVVAAFMVFYFKRSKAS